MAGAYTTGRDASGNWYVYNSGVIPFRTGMYYYGSDTKQFDAAKRQLNSAGGQEQWEGYQEGGGGGAPAGGGYGGGGSGGGAAPRPVLNEAAIRNTQKTIDEIPGLLEAALETEARRYRNTINQFNAQEKQQRKTYDTSTTTNQLNYDETFMDSIRAGIKGLGGLMNILRGTGASGGSVEGDVQDIVGGITAKDIRTGADTQKENQGALDTTLSNFLTELSGKRRENEDTYENNRRAVRRDSDTQLQDLYGKIAGYYSDADRAADAEVWLNKAGNLTPRIAQNSRTQLSKYDTKPVVVKAPTLTAFAAPTQPDAVAVPNEGQVGSGIFTIGERRRDREQIQVPELELVPDLVGA